MPQKIDQFGRKKIVQYIQLEYGRFMFLRGSVYGLISAGKDDIKIRIAANNQPNNDTEDLAQIPSIDVKYLDFPSLVGAGILHTKLWISDKYVV